MIFDGFEQATKFAWYSQHSTWKFDLPKLWPSVHRGWFKWICVDQNENPTWNNFVFDPCVHSLRLTLFRIYRFSVMTDHLEVRSLRLFTFPREEPNYIVGWEQKILHCVDKWWPLKSDVLIKVRRRSRNQWQRIYSSNDKQLIFEYRAELSTKLPRPQLRCYELSLGWPAQNVNIGLKTEGCRQLTGATTDNPRLPEK